MASLLRHFERGRVVATTVVIVTADLLLTVTRMVSSYPAESAKELGIVLMAILRVTSSQSPVTATQRSTAGGGANSIQHESGGPATDSWISSDSPTRGHVPQATEPDPSVTVDHGHRRPAPAAPVVPAGVAAPTVPGCTETDDDDDDRKPVRNGVRGLDGDGRDIDD